MTRRLDTIGLAAAVLLMLGLMAVLPQVADMFQIMQLTLYVVLAIFSLSQAYIWGYGGILCFGQGAFFGLGGYSFAIAAINMGDTTVPFVLAILVAGLAAAALGYFMFYGRLSDVYLGVVTLVFTLIIWKLINSTAGPEYAIGKARLGGFNGIPSVPPLNLPGDVMRPLDPVEIFYVAMGFLIATYIGLRLLARSHAGRVAVAVRENEVRAALLGYDVRRVKLGVFTLGGMVAGMAGALYATYQSFIDPNVFSLEMSAKVLIWVMAGGLGTLIGPIIGCVALQWMSLKLAGVGWINNMLVLGGVLCLLVLVLPRGIGPSLGDAALKLWRGVRASSPPLGAPARDAKAES